MVAPSALLLRDDFYYTILIPLLQRSIQLISKMYF